MKPHIEWSDNVGLTVLIRHNGDEHAHNPHVNWPLLTNWSLMSDIGVEHCLSPFLTF